MKKVFSLILVFAMLSVLILSGCAAKEEEVGADLDTKAMLQAINDKAKAALEPDIKIPAPLPAEIAGDNSITADNCKNYTGLTPEQLDEYVMEGYNTVAGIMTIAFDIVLIKCKDYAAAKEVKKIIASEYDPNYRVCAPPDQAFVVESGRFVFLGGMANNMAEAFQKAFDEQFETKTGDVNKFFERDAGGGDENIGGFNPG